MTTRAGRPGPKKPAQERRIELIQARLTPLEKAHVERSARAAGVKPSEYVRARLLGHVVRPPKAQADAALIAAVNRVGVNVNQLARATHRGSDFTQFWREVGAELSSVLDQVAQAYEGDA